MNKMPKSSPRRAVNKGRKPIMGGREMVKVAIVQRPSVYLDREGSVGLLRAAGRRDVDDDNAETGKKSVRA